MTGHAGGWVEIWQCVSCFRTFPEYVNGCPHHGEDVATAPHVELVVWDREN